MRQTSVDCYNQIKSEGLLSKRREQAYYAMLQTAPCSAGELEVFFNSYFNLKGSWKLLSQLAELGTVKEIGEKTCSITGRNVIEWDLTDSLPEKKEDISKPLPNNLKNCMQYLLNGMESRNLQFLTVKQIEQIKNQ